MDKKEFEKITATFPDVAPNITRITELTKKINKVRRKLKTQRNKYSFLSDLVAIGGTDKITALAIRDCFKHLGFKTEYVEKLRDEDVRVFHEDRLIVIEATGTHKNQSKDKIAQTAIHSSKARDKFPNLTVTGLLIINNDNSLHYTKRDPNPFKNDVDNFVKFNNCGYMTTSELLNGFIKVKTGELTSNDFYISLTKSGEIKY